VKVWVVNPFDNLSIEGYRPQRYEMLAKALSDRRYEVRYWTSDFSHATKARRQLQNDFLEHEFELSLVPTPLYHDNVSRERIASHREFAAEFRRLAEKEIKAHGAPQLIVVSLPPLSLASAAFALREKYGIRVVVDLQDLWPHSFSRLLPKGFRWLGRIVFRREYAMFREAMSKADIVTGVCDSYEAVARTAGASVYARYYLGFPMSGEGEEPIAPQRSVRRIAYVGGLGRSYDLDTAIKALKSLDGWKLDVFGSGGREQELRALAVRSGVGNRVIWHGYVRGDDLRTKLRACSAGLVPMSEDSMVAIPNKIGDYVDAGLPVLSSLDGESSEILSAHGAVVRYRPGDVKDFLRAVSEIDSLDPDFMALRCKFDAAEIYRAFAFTIGSDCERRIAREREAADLK